MRKSRPHRPQSPTFLWKLVIISLSFTLLSNLSWSQTDKENPEFKLAVNLFNDGMYDLAVEQFKNFITAYPNTSQGIDARFYLGLSQMKLHRYEDARITFQNFALAYGDHPKAPEAWMNVGEAFILLNNRREAASSFERVKVFHSSSSLVPDALLKAADLYRSIGDRESAKKVLRTLVQDYPLSKSALPARLTIAEIYAEEGQTELAEREARRVRESDAPNALKARALLSIGKLQAAASLFAQAETTFKTILTAYKETPPAIAASFELAKLEKSAGRFSSAVEHLKSVASIDATDSSLRSQALFELGNVYGLQGDHRNARLAYENILSTFPDDTLQNSALWESGRSAFLNESYRDALDYCIKLLALPESPFERKALILAARSATALRQYSQSVKYYSRYIEKYSINPEAVEVMLELSKLYQFHIQDCKKAITVNEQIEQKFPQTPHAVEALVEIGKCLESLGEYLDAEKTYVDIQTRHPANDYYDSLQQKIEFLRNYKIKQRDQGIEKLARLIGEVLTQQAKGELAFQLGQIYFNDFKDYEAAAKQYSTAIDGGLEKDKFTEAYFYRARAYDLQSEIDSSSAQQALLYYNVFLKQYSSSNLAEDAAYYYYKLKTRNNTPAQIIAIAQEFLTQYPSSRYCDLVLFDLGMAFLTTEKYAEAITNFDTIVTAMPASTLATEALFQRGTAYFKSNQVDSAINNWEKIVKQGSKTPSTKTAMWNVAEYYWQNKQVAKTVELLKKLTAEFSYSQTADQAETFLLDAYLANHEFEKAIGLIESQWQQQIFSSFRESIDYSLLFKLAQAYEKKGDKQRATQYYNQYLMNDRNGVHASSAFYSLGVVARDLGKTTTASSYFKLAAALGSTGNASREIAELLFQTAQYPEAAKQYALLAQSTDSTNLQQLYQSKVIVATLRQDKLTEAASLINNFEKMYGKEKVFFAEFELEKGLYYYRKQDYANARKPFDQLIGTYEKTQSGPWGYYYLGKISEVSNKLEDAAKRYEYVLKHFPDSEVASRALLSLGNMHYNVERYEDAIHYYQLITNSPELAGDILPFAMNNLIEAYEATKLYNDALKITRDFLTRYPNDESAMDKKIKIGTLYIKIGYYDQSILHFQNLLSEAGSSLEAEIRYNIGEAYYYKGDHQQAILEFLKIPYLVSKQGKVNWTATALYMAGQAYEKMSKFDEAIGMYQQIIDRSGIDATFKTAARKEIDRVKTLTKKGSK